MYGFRFWLFHNRRLTGKSEGALIVSSKHLCMLRDKLLGRQYCDRGAGQFCQAESYSRGESYRHSDFLYLTGQQLDKTVLQRTSTCTKLNNKDILAHRCSLQSSEHAQSSPIASPPHHSLSAPAIQVLDSMADFSKPIAQDYRYSNQPPPQAA